MCTSCNTKSLIRNDCAFCGSLHHCDVHCPNYFTDDDIFSIASRRNGTAARQRLLDAYPPGSPQLLALSFETRVAYRLGLKPSEEARLKKADRSIWS